MEDEEIFFLSRSQDFFFFSHFFDTKFNFPTLTFCLYLFTQS